MIPASAQGHLISGLVQVIPASAQGHLISRLVQVIPASAQDHHGKSNPVCALAPKELSTVAKSSFGVQTKKIYRLLLVLLI